MKRTLIKGLAIAVTILSFSGTVAASSVDDLQQEKVTVDSQLTEAKTNKEAYEQQYQYASGQLQVVVNTANWVMRELTANQENIERMTAEIVSLGASIQQSEADYDHKLAQLKDRLRVMYRNSNTSQLTYLLTSGDAHEFVQRVRWLERVFAQDRKIMQDFAVIRADLAAKKKLVEVQKTHTEAEADSKQGEIYTLSLTRASVEERLQVTKSNIDYWTEMVDAFAAKSLELQQIIINLSSGGEYTGGGMAWPTPGYGLITQYYGTFIHPILGVMRNHFAIDVGAPYGARIVAANDGTVISCGWIDGYGYTVIIDHGGGVSTLYAHASSLATQTGAYVSRGSVIAYIGSTGLSTGPHLHFEVRINGVCVNPLDYTSPS